MRAALLAVFAGMTMAATAAGAQQRPADPSAAATPPASPSDSPKWGVYARAQGRSFDWRSRDLGWSSDADVVPGDVEAGYGMRRRGLSALVGYEQPDYGPQGADGPREPAIRRSDDGPPGVFGLSLVARLR